MKYYRNILLLVAVSVSITFLLSDTCLSSTANQSSWSSNEENNGPAVYNNPGYGQLNFRVPADWKSKFEKSPEKRTETITFSPRSGNSFMLMIDPLVQKEQKIDFQNQEIMRKQVEQLGNSFLPHARETQLNIREAKGRYSTFYYFSLTDKAPKPGEWECLTQGRIGVGIYLLHFTVLTHSLDAKEIQEAVQVLTSVEYIKTYSKTVSEWPISSGNKYLVSADTASWSLQFPKAGLELQQSKFRNEGRSRYFHFSDKKGLNISFFIEPASSCRTSLECRKMQHDTPSGSMKVSKYIKDYEINDFAVVEYFLEKAGDDLIRQIPALKDKIINQGNINAHYVKDGYWVDIHISKLNFTDSDKLYFENILKSLVFINK